VQFLHFICLTICTVCGLLFFYIVLFVCVNDAFDGVINDDNNKR